MRVLLTGGVGYIGSHTAVSLVDAGHEVVCFDNLSNSSVEVVERLEIITGQHIPLIVGDIRDRDGLEEVIRRYGVEAVVHFAGLKAVGDSVYNPLMYYDNNVRGTLCLIEAMLASGIKHLIFSSSATVYGVPRYLPLDEHHPTSATNPYGRTKLMIENILTDIAAADSEWRIGVLRYFNPVGAHSSGLIGENPRGMPNNLLPFISQVAAGNQAILSVFGDDYDTLDGTGVRDYIHVTDLAAGHIAALQSICERREPISTWNLGTGKGHSVFEMVKAFERLNGVRVPYQIMGRRPGDVASCYASCDKAKVELGWQASLGLEEMCTSIWRFERMMNTVGAKGG